MISDKILYLVKDSSFGPNPPLQLAICVEVHDNWVGFHSTGRGHQFFGKLVKETEDDFIWHRIEKLGRMRYKGFRDDSIQGPYS